MSKAFKLTPDQNNHTLDPQIIEDLDSNLQAV